MGTLNQLQENISKPAEKMKVSLSYHDQELYAFLSKACTDIGQIDEDGWTPMHRAIEINNIEIMKWLIFKSLGADLNFTNFCGSTPLTFAILKGNLDIIELLVKSGADINFEDKLRWIPLTRAIEAENIDIVRFLCQKGADLNMKVSTGWTPIVKAVSKDNMEIIRLLIDKSADVNLSDKN